MERNHPKPQGRQSGSEAWENMTDVRERKMSRMREKETERRPGSEDITSAVEVSLQRGGTAAMVVRMYTRRQWRQFR